MNIKFSITDYGSPAYAEVVAFREEILRKPLGMHYSEEDLAQEKDWIHITGYQDGLICASATITRESEQRGKVRRVAVHSRLQGQGIGKKLLGFLENYAAEQGFKEIYLHTRNIAVGFYLKNGYSEEGEWFEEIGLPHKKLWKTVKKE